MSLRDIDVFYDTEFVEYPDTIELISIGMIRSDTEDVFYANHKYNPEKVSKNPWLKDNVLNKLTRPIKGASQKNIYINPLFKSELAKAILDFLGPDFERIRLCGYYSDYDHVVFCWIFGAMVDLPEGLPMYTWDLKQFLDDHAINKSGFGGGGHIEIENPEPHHALYDAVEEYQVYKAAKRIISLRQENKADYAIRVNPLFG